MKTSITKRFYPIFFIHIFLLTAWLLPGQNNYWTGAVNADWGNGGNWSLGHRPTDTEHAIIDDEYNGSPVVNQPVFYYNTGFSHRVTIQAGGVLTVSGSANVVSNYLAIDNYGLFFNYGGFSGGANNYGEIHNYGPFLNKVIFPLNNYGLIINYPGGTFYNFRSDYGTINNYGSIINNSILYNYPRTFFYNYGTLTNNYLIRNQHIIVNCGVYTGNLPFNFDGGVFNPGGDINGNLVDDGCDDNDGDGFLTGLDCDDGNPDIYPGATEICDNIDNNCDGQIDENVGYTWYVDNDGDGFGDPANFVRACQQPSGYVENDDDCDDSNSSVYSGAPEICNGIDDDCDGLIDSDDPDQDQDADGICDQIDNCPLIPNAEQADNDDDGEGDTCDADDDNDGQHDADEIACGSDPKDMTSMSPDNDGDQTPDCVDPDDDNDGILDELDNCPTTYNPDQSDFDQDGEGDACDPVIRAINLPSLPIQVNTEIMLTATFDDTDDDNQHIASWNWNDGSSSDDPGQVSQETNTVSGVHAFTSPGVYEIGLNIQDKAGNTDFRTSTSDEDQTSAYLVIYDPNGGFVVGGGWILSPPGAYLMVPEATGKANFGFVSKYKNGASTPTGKTEFQFKATDLSFTSDSYEWLVVSGPQAKFKGEGQINGGGHYGFMVTAIDGQVNGGGGADRLRIKIWDKENNDLIVYDNEIGADDSGYETQELGGGGITIRSNQEKNQIVSENQLTGVNNSFFPGSVESLSVFPNPFNQGTTIQFDVPDQKRILLEVFDSQGQRVSQVLAREMDRGSYSLTWDGSANDGRKLESGVYYIRLLTPNGLQTKAVTIIR